MAYSEIFIGRKDISKRLMADVFCGADSYGMCCSLTGPNGVGKTTLIRHLAKEFREAGYPDTYYFSTILNDGDTFWGFWSRFVLELADTIPEEALEAAPNPDSFYIKKILKAYTFFDENLGMAQSDEFSFRQRAMLHFDHIFEYYTELGIRIIITIDEFDRARTMFKDGQFFQYLFKLTPKGTARLNLSIVTISRRSISTIAHHMQEGSNIQDAYPAVALAGFTNSELHEYFYTYRDLPCGELPEDKKQEIVYICGRSPGLLMGMRHEIELLGEPDVEGIYRNHGAFVNNAFRRMCTLMETEYINKDKSTSGMNVYIQQFIGPAVSPHIREQAEYLYQFGYVTQPLMGEMNVYELAGMDHWRDKDNPAGLAYEPLSPFFVDYVENVILPESKEYLASLLSKTELAVRAFIERVLSKESPEGWSKMVDAACPNPDKARFFHNLRRTAMHNNADERNVKYTKLDVLAFDEYWNIMRHYWDIFGGYFKGASVEKLQRDFHTLRDCRNTSAHLNIDVFNETNLDNMKHICERILLYTDPSHKPDITTDTKSHTATAKDKEKPMAAGAQKSPYAGTEPPDTAGMIGKRYQLVDLSVTSTKGLRGTLAGTRYQASLSKKYLSAHSQTAAILSSASNIQVKPVKWDAHAGIFNIELVSISM